MPMSRVVIVDDSDEYRQLMSLYLQAEGLVVVGQGRDGASGLDAVIASAPDLVLTDLQMPHTDGLWLARRLRRSWPTLPVVMATSSSGSDLGQTAHDAGVSRLVTKRDGAAAVAAAARRQLDRHEA